MEKARGYGKEARKDAYQAKRPYNEYFKHVTAGVFQSLTAPPKPKGTNPDTLPPAMMEEEIEEAELDQHSPSSNHHK